METPASWTGDYSLQLNEIAPDGKIRTCVLFNILQDAAGKHADQLGLGLRQLRENHLIWVLSRIRLRMDEYPEYGDSIRIVTYPSGFDRLFAYRQFEMLSADSGKRLGVAGSAWLTLNPENYHPVPPEKYIRDRRPWNQNWEIFFQKDLGKIHMPQEQMSSLILPHRISCTEIDYNNHLNNAYYAVFTEDFLGEASKSLVRMRDVQINFNASTAFQDTLYCQGI